MKDLRARVADLIVAIGISEPVATERRGGYWYASAGQLHTKPGKKSETEALDALWRMTCGLAEIVAGPWRRINYLRNQAAEEKGRASRCRRRAEAALEEAKTADDTAVRSTAEAERLLALASPEALAAMKALDADHKAALGE